MKRLLALALLLCLFLTGCVSENREMESVLALRADLLKGSGCAFSSVITADYGDETHTFEVTCEADSMGNLSFAVLSPESIRDITGVIDAEAGKLTFDDTALAFSLLADGQLSPVSAPWIFIKALRSGYISSAGTEDSLVRCCIDDSYDEDALNLDIWLDQAGMPVHAEITYRQRRILSLTVSDFRIL